MPTTTASGCSLAQGIVVLLATVAWGLFVRALTDRHVRLTGEAATRSSAP